MEPVLITRKTAYIYIYIFIYLHLFIYIYIISPAQQANWPVYPVIDWLVRQQRRLAEQEDTAFIFFHSGHKKKPDQTSSPPNLKSSCFFLRTPSVVLDLLRLFQTIRGDISHDLGDVQIN